MALAVAVVVVGGGTGIAHSSDGTDRDDGQRFAFPFGLGLVPELKEFLSQRGYLLR